MDSNFRITPGLLQAGETEYYAREALKGFEGALQKNFWHGIAAMLSGARSRLLDFDEIAERIPFEGRYDAGIQDIPVDRIMGSVGRAQDFDEHFLPRSETVRMRWLKIARANLVGEYIPPIEVIQVGAVYFVKDGNHRVSVARVLNQPTITAHVVTVRVPEAIAGRNDLETALGDYEREQFYSQTQLEQICSGAQVEPTVPGFYGKLLEHIGTHRWLMGERRQGQVAWSEAVAGWYEDVYQPVTRVIRENHLTAAFPGRSEADLYIWISEYAWYLSEEGRRVSYAEAGRSIAERMSGDLPRLLWRVLYHS